MFTLIAVDSAHIAAEDSPEPVSDELLQRIGASF